MSTNNSSKKFTKKETYLYNAIDDFYRNKCEPSYITQMIDIISENSTISLRILDWFVTKYSNKKKILIYFDEEFIDVHISYKAQLRSYKKKYFDPFKRRIKFDYTFKHVEQTILTTLGQLNFFKWAIENKIVEYVEKNYEALSKEMNVSNKDDKKRKKEKILDKTMTTLANTKTSRAPRAKTNKSIGVNVSKEIKNEQIKIILTFD